ncbi:MAG TPA: hypothetical protein VKR23_01275 [Gaiellaceae bacterium]|nr:hypothetical protein [Gaiellaceae bacterium]
MTDTAIIRPADGDEIRWRTQRMFGLGVVAGLAATIAESHTDLHDIERLLEAGECVQQGRMCPSGLALGSEPAVRGRVTP